MCVQSSNVFFFHNHNTILLHITSRLRHVVCYIRGEPRPSRSVGDVLFYINTFFWLVGKWKIYTPQQSARIAAESASIYKTLKRQYETSVAFFRFSNPPPAGHCVQLIMSPGMDSVNADPKCNATDTVCAKKNPLAARYRL